MHQILKLVNILDIWYNKFKLDNGDQSIINIRYYINRSILEIIKYNNFKKVKTETPNPLL